MGRPRKEQIENDKLYRHETELSGRTLKKIQKIAIKERRKAKDITHFWITESANNYEK